jgi:hypothetical protein
MFSSFKYLCKQFKNGDQFWSPFFLLCVALFIAPLSSSNADMQKILPIKAWFKITPKADSLLVLPMCQSENKTLIRYEISANKTGTSGRSQNSQGGQLLLPAHKKVSLSTLQFGLTGNDHYQFTMRIFVNNALVTTVTAKYPL